MAQVLEADNAQLQAYHPSQDAAADLVATGSSGPTIEVGNEKPVVQQGISGVVAFAFWIMGLYTFAPTLSPLNAGGPDIEGHFSPHMTITILLLPEGLHLSNEAPCCHQLNRGKVENHLYAT